MLRIHDFHGLSHQIGSQSELACFLIPEPVPHRDRKIENFPILVDWEGEQETDHTVSVEVVGAIMGGMVIKFGTKLKMLTGFFDHGIINRDDNFIFQKSKSCKLVYNYKN